MFSIICIKKKKQASGKVAQITVLLAIIWTYHNSIYNIVLFAYHDVDLLFLTKWHFYKVHVNKSDVDTVGNILVLC